MHSLLKRSLARPALIRALRASPRPRVIALMYHDLCEDDDFPNWMRVRVSEFAAQIRMLQGLGEIVDATAVRDPAALPADRLHFVLTFDDGYVNNLRLALPVLERLRAPAQFFISTRPMQTQEAFWSDVVVTPIQAGGLDAVDLSEFGLGRFTFRAGPADARWDDIQRLLVALKAQGDEDEPVVAAVLDRLRRDHRANLERHLPRYRPLDAQEVAQLAASPWCRVGSHAHHHRILTRLGDEDLDGELRTSRAVLAETVSSPVDELAYPNGDQDERVRRAAACAGYECAYTVVPGIVCGQTEPLARPRLGVSGVAPSWLLRFQILRALLADRRPRG